MVERQREIRIHDWDPEGSEVLRNSQFNILDTTLRDGVQPSGIKQPTLDEKLTIIDFDAQVGIEAIDICLPGEKKTPHFQEGIECARYIAERYPQIEIVVLTPTREDYVEATLDFADKAGVKLSSILFRGSSDLRLYAEDWELDQIVADMYKFSKQLTDYGHKVISATEDTTRSKPDVLKEIFLAGKAGGATEFCIADTVGKVDPVALTNQINWLKGILGNNELQIQFHGHDDIEHAVSNSMTAIKAGVSKVHATWLGVGERAGNTSLEGLLSSLEVRGANRYDLKPIVEVAILVSRSFGRPISPNHPLVGENVFKTTSGIHGAAIHKARERGLPKEVEELVYNAVGPAKVGREHEFGIGPLSGHHIVRLVLDKMSLEFTSEVSEALLYSARALGRELTDSEIKGIIREEGRKRNNHYQA